MKGRINEDKIHEIKKKIRESSIRNERQDTYGTGREMALFVKNNPDK